MSLFKSSILAYAESSDQRAATELQCSEKKQAENAFHLSVLSPLSISVS